MTEPWRGEKIGGMTPEEMNEFLKGPVASPARLPQTPRMALPRALLVPLGRRVLLVVPRLRSEWAFHMALDPRVCLLIDEPEPPIRKVICEGIAVIVEAGVGPTLENGQKSIWNQIGERYTGRRYLGTERADEYRGSVNVEPCWTFKIVPRHITSWAGCLPHGPNATDTQFSPDQTGKAKSSPPIPADRDPRQPRRRRGNPAGHRPNPA